MFPFIVYTPSKLCNVYEVKLYYCFQVSTDGCIFVWTVPAPFSSKMLQKIEENSCSLFPIIRAPTLALSRIEFLEGNDSLFKFNSEDEVVLENSKSKQVNSTVSCQGGNPQETTPFKFSISRLPKWAQTKVTEPNIIPTTSECTSLQVGFNKLINNRKQDEILNRNSC